ncbi:hypothetical protein [Marinobacter sp. F4216]|uniref:hypothetical protein n=1 Tax=Marinobacter sp. F4216 TaxID=2874281 RepID=UPI001CC1A15A|nr:hypothetical protein [Marinobacter sp. F4216]MBZ2169468.1 hypothetical protein [Marinobacter sp. F4216]
MTEQRQSRLKPVNTQSPEELRKHFRQMNGMLKASGGGVSEEDIERMIHLHCEEGVPLDECVERITQGR